MLLQHYQAGHAAPDSLGDRDPLPWAVCEMTPGLPRPGLQESSLKHLEDHHCMKGGCWMSSQNLCLLCDVGCSPTWLRRQRSWLPSVGRTQMSRDGLFNWRQLGIATFVCPLHHREEMGSLGMGLSWMKGVPWPYELIVELREESWTLRVVQLMACIHPLLYRLLWDWPLVIWPNRFSVFTSSSLLQVKLNEGEKFWGNLALATTYMAAGPTHRTSAWTPLAIACAMAWFNQVSAISEKGVSSKQKLLRNFERLTQQRNAFRVKM